MTADPAGFWEGDPANAVDSRASWRPSRRSWTSGAKSTKKAAGAANGRAARCYGRTQSSSTSSRRSWA